MKTLAIFLALFCYAFAAQPSVEKQLDAMKAQFPKHVAGKVTPRSEPLVQQMYEKYKKRVEKITIDSLSKDVIWLTDHVRDDIRSSAWGRNEGRLTQSQRHAHEQNESWLKQKMLPYVQKLAQIQRGR